MRFTIWWALDHVFIPRVHRSRGDWFVWWGSWTILAYVGGRLRGLHRDGSSAEERTLFDVVNERMASAP